jgi:hypothetical protein
MTTPAEPAKRRRYGRRTLEAAKFVSRRPGSTSNDVVNRVGSNRAGGQEAVRRALAHGLIENRGTPRRFALYVTSKGKQALENAWPRFSDDAATWRPGDDILGCIDAVLSQQ